MRLRSKLDGRYAGMGVIPAFVEYEEVWRDIKCENVIFPKHNREPGEVKVYHISEIKLNT